MKQFEVKVPKPEPVEHRIKYTGDEIIALIKKDLQDQGNVIPEGVEVATFSVKRDGGGVTHGRGKDTSFNLVIKVIQKGDNDEVLP